VDALLERCAHVFVLDRAKQPPDAFYEIQARWAHLGGTLHYDQVDVSNADEVDGVIANIVAEYSRLDGLVAAAAIQHVKPALEYEPHKIAEVCFQAPLIFG
jgi:NAD(P)-dependent dehydrogenase (short-subunit alcohol dehydrogenase family)